MNDWWRAIQGASLAQGDYLPRCLIPVLPSDYGEKDAFNIEFGDVDLIVVTQSCDLANDKISFVAMCPIYSIPELQAITPHYSNIKNLEDIRRGYLNSLHLLAGVIDPTDRMAALVADFRQLYSLPIGYARRHADQLGQRYRLNSPYLEHFSQAFARFFMRVGLPSDLPRYK